MAKSKARYRIVWRAQAEVDLNRIIDYIARGSPVRARSFGQALRDKTLQLSRFPNTGRTGRPGLPDWLYELVAHPHYIIFYRVHDETRTVEILRVKHTARQAP